MVLGCRLCGFRGVAPTNSFQNPSVPLSPDLPPQPVLDGPGEFIFTYDVTWEESAIRWASRWDLYLYMGDDQIHWFSILNSLAIVLLLSGIVAMIMMRTLRRDFNRCGDAAQFGGQFSAQFAAQLF